MSKILEIHVLQNLAPGNLNRDDTGAPKDAMFGGVRRARLSSQSIKRAVRRHFREQKLLPEDKLALRTRNLIAQVAPRLEAQGVNNAAKAVEEGLKVLSLAAKKKGEAEYPQTEYLLFLANGEIAAFEAAVLEHHAELVVGKPKDVAKKAIAASIGSARAVDVALFGRMIADDKGFNVDAACQVAHALSTHRVDREFDFFTAVDDRPQGSEAVSGMLGTVEFNSACYYRYAVIHLDKLLSNVGGADADLAVAGIGAFVRAFVEALPSGKQNTFAAHNPPDFVAVRVREGMPINLANAFEKPVRATAEEGLTGASVARLKERWNKYDSVYGGTGTTTVIDVTATWGDEGKVSNTAELVDRAKANARAALRGD
jgi:CRISPR system Cascade subunit CasC